VLHCCKAHAIINMIMGNSTPSKSVTPENFILKFCARDEDREITLHANFGFNRYSGTSPQIGEMLPLCDFFDCPVLSCPALIFSRCCAQVKPLNLFLRFMAQTTCFHARIVLLGVRTMGDVIWGKYALKSPAPNWLE